MNITSGIDDREMRQSLREVAGLAPHDLGCNTLGEPRADTEA